MRRAYLLTGYRLFFGLLGFSAVITEVATLHQRGRLDAFNFFSYFTIQSNLIAVAILLLTASLFSQALPAHTLAMVRGAATLYIVTTGIVFSLLLAGIEGAEFTAVPWDNWVLHYIMPLAVAVDWFVDLPAERLPWRRAIVWLLYPLAYVVYSLIRGPVVGWYPYPFLNPAPHGYIAVVGTSIAIALGLAAFIWVLTRFTGVARPDSAQGPDGIC